MVYHAHDLHAVLSSLCVIRGPKLCVVGLDHSGPRCEPHEFSLVAQISGSQPHGVDVVLLQVLAKLDALLSSGKGQQLLTDGPTVLEG